MNILRKFFILSALLCSAMVAAGEDRSDPAANLVRALPEAELRLLVEDALRRNPRLAISKAMAQAADQRAPQVRSLPDPTASLSLFLLSPQTRVGPQQASVGVSQRLPWFDKLKLKEQMAMLEAAAAWIRLDTARLDLVTKVRVAYLELQYLQRERKVILEDLSTLGHYEELAQARYASGIGIAQTAIKIQADITRGRLRLLNIKDREVVLLAEINALRDRPENTPVILGDLPPEIEDLPSFSDLKETTLKNRPEFAEIQARIDAAAVRIDLSKTSSRPDFTVGLNYALVGKRDDRAGRVAPPAGNGDDILGLTGGLTLPIWKDKIEAEVEEAVNLRLVAEESRRAFITEIDGDIAALSHRIPLIKEQLHLFDEVLTAQAEESLHSAELAYASGTVGALDLLDAERTLLGVRIGSERARFDIAIAVAKLEGVIAGPLETTNRNGHSS